MAQVFEIQTGIDSAGNAVPIQDPTRQDSGGLFSTGNGALDDLAQSFRNMLDAFAGATGLTDFAQMLKDALDKFWKWLAGLQPPGFPWPDKKTLIIAALVAVLVLILIIKVAQ